MKKNNLIEMLQGCSMRNGMPVSASNPDGGQTCDGNRQSRLMSYRCYLRNLAMIFAILTLSIANIGMAWGANTPAAAGTYTLTASNKPGDTNKFYKLGNGVYIHRRNNSSQGDDGLKVTKENTNGIAVYVNSSMNLSCSIYKASSKEEQTVGINVYTLSNGSTTFDSFESGTDNSTTVSVTLSASATYTTSVSFAAAESKTAETKSSSNITLEAGYYYIVPAETTNEGKTYLKSITLAAAAAPSCTARTFKSGEKIYFKDQESNFDFDALWKVESGQLYAYFWNDGESEKAWSDAAGTCVEGSWNAANAIYELTVPGLGKEYTHVLFTRGNAQNFDSGTWDKTTNQEPCEGKNLFYVEKGKYADHIYYGHWGNYTPGGKTVYFDARIAPDTWTTAYVRIGHGSSNSAWGAMTKVAGTKCLYSQTTSKWASHTDFAIADKAGWAGSNAIDQPEKTYTNGSWSSSEYKMTKQTNYQQYAIENDIYICPKATSVLEHECQYYQVTNANSTTSSRIDENTTAMALPEYTVTATGSHCTVTMEKYNNDAGSSTTALASGGTVLPTQYVKVTVTPDANYQFSSVEVTGAGTVTAAAAGTPGVYYITGDATITATCTCVALAVNRGGTEATPAEGEPLGTAYGTLTCSATTGVIASYQWKQNTSATTEGAGNAEGTGAKTASFSPNPAAAGTYYYYCVATDACGNSANTSFSGAFKFNAAAYTVTYNKNGDGAGGEGSVTGTVPTDATSYTSGQRPVVKGPGDLAWDGHTFIGWNDKADGSGTYYSEKANFAISASKTLYAQWRTASSCPGSEGGTVFSLSMNNRTESGLQLAKGVSVNLSSHAAITNGGASLTNISTSDDNKATITKTSPALIQFGGAAAMLAIYLDCALQKDDEITITASASQEVCFTATPSKSKTLATSSQTYTIPSGSPLIGKKIIYIWRKGTTTFGISALSITRPASVSTYTVTYKVNGGTGSDVVDNAATTISDVPGTFTAPGAMHFMNWNTVAGGTGVTYEVGDAVKSDLTLYAQWRWQLSYDANAGGDAVSNMPEAELHNPGIYTLSTKVPTRTGYTFDCWNRNAAGTGDCFAAGASFTTGALNETLYAKWTEDECTPTTLFSMVVNPSAEDYKLIASTEMTSELTSRLTSYSGGTPSIYNTTTSSSKDVIKNNTVYLGSNDVYLKVVLSGGNTLQAGDVITITTRTAYQPYITKTTTRTTTPTMTKTGSSDPYTYSITLANTNSASGKDIIGGGTLYFWKNSKAVEIRSITITRPCDESAETCKTPNITNIASTTEMTTAETKSLNVTLGNADALTGTVSYAWTNADGSAIDAAAKATGTTTARLTLTEPAAGTYTFKCTVTNDCGGEGSQSATSAILTVNVTESAGCTEIAKVIVSGTSTGTESGTKIAKTDGYGVNLENTQTTHGGNTGYKIGSSKYVYLQLANGEQFQNGDKVKVYITNLSDQGDHKLHIFQGTTAAGTEVATVETPVLGWNEATLSNVTTGNRSLTIHRSSGTTEQNHGIYAFAVERCKDCSPATHKGLAYTKTSYTVGETAEALTVTNPENVDTYQWKWNTTNDRTSGSNCGTNSASFTPPTTAEAEGTRYYWCELTNDCGTVKTSAVGITVSAVLTEVTVTWTNPAGTVNYGGGGYTIKATVDPAAWDGTLDASMLTAPDGIRIYDVTTGTDGESKKYIQATFDVQTTFDREANATVIPFALTLAATATYESKISEHNVTYDACAAGGGGSNVYVIGYSNSDATNISGSADFRAYETASDWYSKGNTTFTDKTSTDGFTISATEKSSYNWQNNGTFTESSTNNCRLKTIKLAKGSGVTIRWKNDELSFSKVRFIGRNTAAGDPTTFTVSNGTTEKTFTFEAGNSEIQTKEVTMDFVSGNTKGIVISGGTKEVNILIELIPAGTGTITTALTWSNSQASGVTLTKDEGTADFAITAVRDAVATTSLGAVTYSSSDASVATVNETTGQVHIADNIDFGGATYKETTITATLAASGCFKRAEITYVLQINERACEDVAGTASAASEGCNTTLTLSGYTAGATIQWYKDGVSLGSADGAQTATYVATSAGDYYAVTHKTCDRTSNTVTVTSTAVSATKIVDEWYVKNGRRTPDIALVKTKNATGFIVTTGSPASDITSTGIGGCGFYLGTDGIIYLRGAKNDGSAPSGMTEGDTEISITASGCTDAAPVTITIHRQVETDKYVLAYVVTGTQDGGWTENTPYNQTTGVELYRTLTNHFDLQATNIYATTDEQKIKEYYSRYDIIFITDYPNTKKTNTTTKKSYVDALGAMIDIRPILTMEAWMSGLTNWSEKGVKGSPKSPTTRQYNMLLQCKDHEIFSGTTVETIGEGDDVKFKINMVDSTKLLYDTLDTKYGAGTHEEKKGYCYGTHPALQGFVYDEALADMLPLGLIDDGAGNDLQVGLERQKEMEARMMVLGINADAMERLSDDGETVIVNALKYLMKKDAEDISDCSIYFDNAGGDNLWSNVANWGPSRLTLPQPTQEARIFQPCIVQGEANAASITIISGGKYNHGTTDANGSLTIAKSGILKVGGRIVAASAPNYYEVRPTDASKLIIEADHLQTGALIHGHKSGELNATVQLVSSSYSVIEQVDGKNKKKKYWQYIGLPVQSALAEDAFYGAYTYKYNEPSGWEKKGTGTTLEEFWGIGLSVDNIALGISSPVTFNISGALALATDRDIELTKTAEAGKGQNMIGNSWTAPIHLVNMTADDFENATATIYIYNTGRDEQAPGGDVGTSTFANGSTQPGQWISIPVAASKLDPWLGPKVIPAMQAFEVDVADGSTSGMLHLNYDKHVRNIGTAPEENAALKAPKRYQADEPSMMRLRVADTATYTDLYLIEGEEFSDEFDNGYDGKYQQCDGRSAALYALSPIGNMAVLAQQSINNTAIVFRPGRQNEYTFTFGYNGEVAYYLNDLLLEQSTEIREGNEYRFTCNEGDMESRFVVSTTPLGAPDITTGIGNAGHPEKVQKIMYKDHIYIIRAGRVYDIVGKEVR